MCAGKALATYEAEARKCVLVCANCHGEIEMGLIPSPPAGARFSSANSQPTPSAGSAVAT
jgi:cytochrome c553